MPYHRSDDGTIYDNPTNKDNYVFSSGRVFSGPYEIEISVYAGHTHNGNDGEAGHYTLEITAPSPLFIAEDQEFILWNLFPTISYDGTITGSFAIEIDVDEEMEVTGIPFPAIPWWAIGDGPAAIMHYREKLRNAADNVRVDVVFGDLEYHQNFTRPDTESLGFGSSAYYYEAECGVASREIGGIQVAKIDIEDTNCWTNRGSITERTGTMAYKIGAIPLQPAAQLPFIQLAMATNGVSASHIHGGKISTGCAVYQYMPVKAKVCGRARVMEEDYPLDLDVFIENPEGSEVKTFPPGGAEFDFTQINGIFYGVPNETPYDPDFGLGVQTSYDADIFPYDDDGGPNYTLKGIIDENGYDGIDETTDNRFQGRGKRFGTLTITHEPTYELFSGISFGWTEYTPTTPIVTEAWRYLKARLRVVGADGVQFRIKFNEKKSYTITAGDDGEWIEPIIDTCYPNVVAPGVPATQDSRWPVISATNNTPVNEAKNWGLNTISKIEIIGLPEDCEVHIDWIKGHREDYPRLQFLSARYNSKVMYWNNSPGSSPERKRHGLFLVDGRTAQEIPDGSGAGAGHTDITTYAAEINKIPGWTATLSGFSDAYLNAELPSQFIAGEGAIWDEDGFETFTDKHMAGSSIAIPCQYMWDQLYWYPGIGDPFTGEGYDDYEHRLTARFVKFYRAQGHGFLSNSAGRIQSGKQVDIYRYSDNNYRGSGISDSTGWFETGMGYGSGMSTHSFRVAGDEFGSAVLHTRKRTRCNLRLPNELTGAISNDVSRHGRHVGADAVNEDGIVRLHLSANADHQNTTDKETPFESGSVCVRWEKGQEQRIALMYIDAADSDKVKLAYTPDEGESWTMPTTINSAGVVPAFVFSNSGTRFFYWLEDNGTSFDIKGQIRNALDDVIEDTFEVLAGVDAGGLGVTESVHNNGEHNITIAYVSSGAYTTIVSRNGIDFS